MGSSSQYAITECKAVIKSRQHRNVALLAVVIVVQLGVKKIEKKKSMELLSPDAQQYAIAPRWAENTDGGIVINPYLSSFPKEFSSWSRKVKTLQILSLANEYH